MINDPFILLSFINTKLRDSYASLDDLCEDLLLSKKEVNEKLNKEGYYYNQAINQFKYLTKDE